MKNKILKKNDRVSIQNFPSFYGVDGTIVKKMDVKYKIGNRNRDVFHADKDYTRETLYLVRFDCDVVCERNGFTFGEELMLFPGGLLKKHEKQG